MAESKSENRFGRIALIGEPNVGKSTLMNSLINYNMAITTPKVQTTRFNMIGITSIGKSQLVFMDTPGIFKAKKALERTITSESYNALDSNYILCIIVDAVKLCSLFRTHDKNLNLPILDFVKSKIKNKHIILIINKIDRIRKENLLPILEHINKNNIYRKIFLISALKRSGVDDLLNYLADNAPHGNWLYGKNEITDTPIRTLAEERTREAIFFQLNKELPYSIKVETEKWQEGDGGIDIYQVIFVLKTSQKKIVLGKDGERIRSIGTRARRKISALIGGDCKINLYLFVKVRENWIKNDCQ